ncbi:MAG: hypothetical protein PHY93_17750 [Bacteriovorax sp.]|nr:hypothetical protein [Bacteriovorax sp.]
MSSSLNRFDRFCFYYLVGLSPLTIGFMIWATVTDFMNKTTSGLGWDIFGWVFIVWILSLLYLVTKMVFSKTIRDVVMTKLAGMKERDEREAVVAGSAAKFSFLSTLALLLFLFIFSVTTVTVNKHPKDLNHKRGSVTLGFKLNAIDETALIHEVKGELETYNYKSLPLAKPVIFLLLIFWQIGSYHLIARRELRE